MIYRTESFGGLIVGTERPSTHSAWVSMRESIGGMGFFVPGITDADRAEEEYRRLADAKGCPVVPPDERVRSIAFEHTASVTIVAEVGRRREMHRHVRPKKKSDPVPMPEKSETGSTVVAIIEADHDLVYVWESDPTEWSNPALVGRGAIRRIDLFGSVSTG